MAAEGVCPFPLPPAQYYKVYTDENVEKQLVPDPPTPAEGAYAMFGASFEVSPFKTECCFAEKRVYSNLLDYEYYVLNRNKGNRATETSGTVPGEKPRLLFHSKPLAASRPVLRSPAAFLLARNR